MTFLQLFPNFVEEFNAHRTHATQTGRTVEHRTPYLCPYPAGITDSTKIAQFLRYSVTTIYNYRTRVRNKGEKEMNLRLK